MTENSVIRLFGYSVIRKARQGFTLIEVNLAMLIMAGGILSIVGLYAFGFRENRQSREDVAATALADSVISPLVSALTATNLKWSVFKRIGNYPSEDGWKDYFNSKGIVTDDPQKRAEGVFGNAMPSKGDFIGDYYEGDLGFPSGAMDGTGMSCGLVVLHDENSAVVRIAFRAVKTDLPGALLSMPLFYTEARFQGIVDQ